MQVYEIKLPIYAESQHEAEAARQALRQFVADHRQRGIPVTAAKVSKALTNLMSNPFIRYQVERFLR
jgi:hypothetical protein